MNVNFWAVLVSAIAAMAVGSIWYGPLFGKMFMHEMGFNKMSPEEKAEMKKNMGLTYLWQFVASIVMFYVLAWVVVATGRMDVKGAIHIALLAWIGFIVPLKLGDALWGGKMSLFWLGIGNSLVTILVGAIIIGAWH